MIDSGIFEGIHLKKQSQFLKGQNDVNLIMTMVYGEYDELRRRKNKANSKPNKANLSIPKGVNY